MNQGEIQPHTPRSRCMSAFSQKFAKMAAGCGLVFGVTGVFISVYAQAQNDRSSIDSNAVAKSGIEILEIKWKREARLPRNFDPAIIPTGGTFSDSASRNSGSGGSNSSTSSARVGSDTASDTFPATPNRLPVFYVYSMKVKNQGTRVIEGIAWDYLFIDPGLKIEVGRHQFLSYTRIPNEKTVVLHADMRTPPIRIIAGRSSGNAKDRTHYEEKAVIQCVMYDDGTFWKGPRAAEGICEFLNKSKPNKHKRT